MQHVVSAHGIDCGHPGQVAAVIMECARQHMPTHGVHHPNIHTDKLDVIRLMRPLKLHTIILKTWKNEFFHTDILTQVIIQSPERAINILDRLSMTRADVLSGNKVTLRNCVKYGRDSILDSKGRIDR